MRLFFSLLLDKCAAARLIQLTERCLLQRSARTIDLANLHLTLAFIGDIEPSKVYAIRQLCRAIRSRCVSVRLDRCEYCAGSGVVVATVSASEQDLADLGACLQSAVAPFRRAAHAEPPWRPHVTLARNVSQPPVLPAMSPIYWVSDSFSLMGSERSDGRSVYTVVDTHPLLDKI